MVILVLVSRWVAWIGRSGCLRGSLLYPHVWAKGLPYREVAPSFLVHHAPQPRSPSRLGKDYGFARRLGSALPSGACGREGLGGCYDTVGAARKAGPFSSRKRPLLTISWCCL